MIPNGDDSRRDFYKALAISLLVMVLYWLLATRSTLWDRDEPRFCRATAEMLESGNWLYPTFNGALRPDKPILIYWLMAWPMKILGPTELACRFWSGLATGFTCLLTWLLGRRLFGPSAAGWALAILASSSLLLFMGTLATVDALLLALMMSMMVLYYCRPDDKPLGTMRTGLMALAAGGALLTKGPVGLLPFLVISVTALANRKIIPQRRGSAWPVLVALLLGAGIFLAWALPANRATGGEFYQQGIGHHVIDRAVDPQENHGGDFLLFLPYYLPVILIGFFPWSLFLPGAVAAVWIKQVGDEPARRLLISWCGAIFILMTLVMTKLPHYVLFIWPALALGSGATLVAAQDRPLSETARKWLRGGVWFYGIPASIGALGLMVAPWLISGAPAELRVGGLVCGLVLGGMTWLAVRHQLAERFQASARILLAGMAVFLVVAAVTLIPAIERAKLSPAIVRSIRNSATPDAAIACYGYKEPSLNFYLGRHIDYPKKIELPHWCQNPGPGFLVISAQALESIQSDLAEPLAVTQYDRFTGINYSNGKTDTVLVLHRAPQAAVEQ